MAELLVSRGDLWLRLRRREKLLTFHRDLHLPLSAVREVRVAPSAWGELRGWRSTGVALPGRTAKGLRRHGTGWDYTMVRGSGPVLVVELNGASVQRVVLTVPDAAATATEVAAAAGIAGPSA